MIKSIHFKNFKALRDATLPLGRFTLIVGPNGSGKSTAMQALQIIDSPDRYAFHEVATAGLEEVIGTEVRIKIDWEINYTKGWTEKWWKLAENGKIRRHALRSKTAADEDISSETQYYLDEILSSFRIFSLDAQAISVPVTLQKYVELDPNGSNLAGVLDNLRDKEPERFTALNEELEQWIPEFDRILFDTPEEGKRAFLLRTHIGKHRIKASDLSQGTLFALTFLTLSYLPNPPLIVCFEEPEHGIHPRLLREIRDAMYRLCYPEDYGDKRKPVQVIATTHSPYMLDLYKEHPEEVVIAHKDEQGIHFERLSDKPDFDEFLQDAPLGEVWYSGILGGVPSKP
jgi:predicted ATPase